jgi:protein-L-isoaspartate(D-aspartate) O-methyltransferase
MSNLNPNRNSERGFNLSRNEMVDKHLIARGIHNDTLLEAFRQVPRHLFVPPALVNRAYDDDAIPIGAGQTISKPFIIAKSIEMSKPDRNKVALEIGTGSGYQTAVMSLLFRHVYSLERISSLANIASERLSRLRYGNVTVKAFDGTYGWSAQAPFDVIIVSAAAPEIPQKLVAQLKNRGVLICPVGDQSNQVLKVVTKTGEEIDVIDIMDCRFVPLVGRYGWNNV